MTLLLRDADVQGLLPMEACISAMETAYAEYAGGTAANRPRVRYSCPTPDPALHYFANIIAGAVPAFDAAAVRIDSMHLEALPGAASAGRRASAQSGLVLLYSLETCELLAVIHDTTLQAIRVGATTAVAVKHLARANAGFLGLFGTGSQARTALEGIVLVRPVRSARVFSPNPEHRRRFAAEMASQLDIAVTAVDEPGDVVHGADIVCCATSSSRPVFDGRRLEPGQLVTTLVNSDLLRRPRSEVDETTFVRSDVICINDEESLYANRQAELLDLIESGQVARDRVRELGQVVAGTAPGRERPEQIIYYKSNTGMGIQFAAAGAIVYREALKAQRGQELPSEWFLTDVGGPRG